MTRLTFHSGQYEVPSEWRDPSWVTDFNNFPDPMFYHLDDEYDRKIGDRKTLTFSYIAHLAGTQYARDLYSFPSDPSIKVRAYKGKPYSYFLFAVGAVTLLNKPRLMRNAYTRSLCGGDVINYVNKIPLPELFPEDWFESPLFRKLYERKNILPTKFSALFSRTFNATAGLIDNAHRLKIKTREPSLDECPNCKAIVEKSTGNFYTKQNTFLYNRALQRLEKQRKEQKEYESR